jgi:hypothetical protein
VTDRWGWPSLEKQTESNGVSAGAATTSRSRASERFQRMTEDEFAAELRDMVRDGGA